MIGKILWKDKFVSTPLTANEQYTWMTLWSIADAPLVFGGDMTQLDDFTLNILTNDEVIAVNQDASRQAGCSGLKRRIFGNLGEADGRRQPGCGPL